MGVAIGDYDHNGTMDIFKTNFAGDTSTLCWKSGKGFGDDRTFAAGIGVNTRWLGWATAFVDFGNDGWLDLFLANGHVYPEVAQLKTEAAYAQRKVVYMNRGNGRFEDVTEQLGAPATIPRAARGAAFGDIDNDGDVDIVITNVNAPPDLFRTDTEAGRHWLLVKLVGTTSNRSAIGRRPAPGGRAGRRSTRARAQGCRALPRERPPARHRGSGGRPARASPRFARAARSHPGAGSLALPGRPPGGGDSVPRADPRLRAGELGPGLHPGHGLHPDLPTRPRPRDLGPRLPCPRGLRGRAPSRRADDGAGGDGGHGPGRADRRLEEGSAPAAGEPAAGPGRPVPRPARRGPRALQQGARDEPRQLHGLLPDGRRLHAPAPVGQGDRRPPALGVAQPVLQRAVHPDGQGLPGEGRPWRGRGHAAAGHRPTPEQQDRALPARAGPTAARPGRGREEGVRHRAAAPGHDRPVKGAAVLPAIGALGLLCALAGARAAPPPAARPDLSAWPVSLVDVAARAGLTAPSLYGGGGPERLLI